MQVIITLQEEIKDPEEGRQLYNLVKNRLADIEDITITGHITNHFSNENPPLPGRETNKTSKG